MYAEKIRGLALAFVVCMVFSYSAAAEASVQELEGVYFQKRFSENGVLLELTGVGILRYKLLFKVYVAGFYLESGVRPEQALGDVSKRLEIEYFYEITAQEFATATNAGVAANVSPDKLLRLKPRIDQLNGLYRNVKPGDSYGLTYVKDIGTTLSLNGEVLGTIKGADFAQALFAIWLGPNPLDAGLKSALLGLN